MLTAHAARGCAWAGSGEGLASITTLHQGLPGDMDESLLERRDEEIDTDVERTSVVEYRCRCHAELVHRSVHVRLKQGVSPFAALGNLG